MPLPIREGAKTPDGLKGIANPTLKTLIPLAELGEYMKDGDGNWPEPPDRHRDYVRENYAPALNKLNQVLTSGVPFWAESLIAASSDIRPVDKVINDYYKNASEYAGSDGKNALLEWRSLHPCTSG